MKTETTKIMATVDGKQVDSTFEVKYFETAAEAIEKLGEGQALQYINYSFALGQRDVERRKLIAIHTTEAGMRARRKR